MSPRSTSGRDAPLLAWGDALRAAKRRRRRLVRRAAMVGAICAIVLAPTVTTPAPRLVWNVSPSAPLGLYGVTPGATVKVGDMVVARLPEVQRQLAAERRYLPANVPLIKRVTATAGDEVCASGRHVTINGVLAARRQVFDRRGRRLPFWLGCLRLRGRQLFLLMDSPDSFDGRYFGVTEGKDVIGRTKLLWRW